MATKLVDKSIYFMIKYQMIYNACYIKFYIYLYSYMEVNYAAKGKNNKRRHY